MFFLLSVNKNLSYLNNDNLKIQIKTIKLFFINKLVVELKLLTKIKFTVLKTMWVLIVNVLVTYLYFLVNYAESMGFFIKVKFIKNFFVILLMLAIRI